MSTAEPELQFAKNTAGFTLAVRVLDDIDNAVDLADTDDHAIILKKPSGTIVSVPAKAITTINSFRDAITTEKIMDGNLLDERGRWQYWGAYTRDGDKRITYDRFGLRVT